MLVACVCVLVVTSECLLCGAAAGRHADAV